jgi:MarR family transcriptional regulator, organic hydroperoxide resistance regulator
MTTSADLAEWVAPGTGRLLALDAQFCFPIYAATNLIARAYRPLLEPLGLTYPQYLVMLVLWESEPVTVKALGERLLLDSGTLSPLLKRLEERRLVKKKPDREDARRVVVSLTTKGRALKVEAEKVPEALLCRLLAEGGPAAAVRVDALLRQLQGLVGALSASLAARP